MAKRVQELSDQELEQQIQKFRQLCQKNSVPEQTQKILSSLVLEKNKRSKENELGFVDEPQDPNKDSSPRLKTSEAHRSGRLSKRPTARSGKRRKGSKSSDLHPGSRSSSKITKARGNTHRRATRRTYEDEKRGMDMRVILYPIIFIAVAALGLYLFRNQNKSEELVDRVGDYVKQKKIPIIYEKVSIDPVRGLVTFMKVKLATRYFPPKLQRHKATCDSVSFIQPLDTTKAMMNGDLSGFTSMNLTFKNLVITTHAKTGPDPYEMGDLTLHVKKARNGHLMFKILTPKEKRFMPHKYIWEQLLNRCSMIYVNHIAKQSQKK